MAYLRNIVTPTGRAALIALVISLFAVARIFGVVIPEVADDAVSKAIDSFGIFFALLLSGSALHKAPPPSKTSSSKSSLNSNLVAVIMLVALTVGCSSFGHWEDPTLEKLTDAFCMRKARAHEAELKKEAEARGIPLAELLSAFQMACLLRMQQTAEQAGMAGVQARLARKPEPESAPE